MSTCKKEAEYLAAEHITIPDLFHRICTKHRNKAAILYEDQTWSFQDLDNYSNAVANYFQNEGFTSSDTVAILLENSPEFVGLWLGMAKVGIHAAFINTNLREDALLHCVTMSEAKALVFGKHLAQSVADVASSLAGIINNDKSIVFQISYLCIHRQDFDNMYISDKISCAVSPDI